MEKQIEKFQILRPLYIEFNERIKVLLKSIIDENNIKYQIIESRTKSIESFKEKICRKNNKYSNPIEEMTDLAGVRIIVYYQDDVEKIETIIKKEFQIDKENSIDKGKLLKANEFGYQSVHYVIKLSEERRKLIEWKKYSNYKAEIQLRTVLQHSWASISHELEYKKNYEIPSVLQRRLFRLASLIELADEEFKNTRDQHNALVIKISEGKSKNYEENIEILEELNLLTLKNYITSAENVAKITKEAVRAGFKSTLYEGDRYLSQIINLSNLKNIKTIPDLDQFLADIFANSFNLFEIQISKTSNEWTGSPGFFILLLLINENIKNISDSNFLIKEGWSPIIADRVLNTFKDLKK